MKNPPKESNIRPQSSTAVSPKSTNAKTSQMVLRVVSDTICPWCYVGKRRIERALSQLAGDGLELTMRWLPFELNPDMPKEGLDRKTYRSAKFGSWERSLALDAQVAAQGAKDGVAFNHDRMEKTPNTRFSHRLIWLASEEGGAELQDQVVEGLFAAYFTEGRDIGDTAMLAKIGGKAGLSSERIEQMFARDEGISEIVREEAKAQAAGVTGVPSVFLGDQFLFSGAQPVPEIVEAIRAAVAIKADEEQADVVG